MEVELKNAGWFIAREIIGWIITLYGLFFASEIFVNIKKDVVPSPQIYIPCIYGILLVVCGIGLINRQNWSRIMAILLALLSIPFYIYTGGENVSAHIGSLIIYCCVCLSIVWFFLYPKVKEQFQ